MSLIESVGGWGEIIEKVELAKRRANIAPSVRGAGLVNEWTELTHFERSEGKMEGTSISQTADFAKRKQLRESVT